MAGPSSLFHMTAPIDRRQFWIGLACLFAIVAPLILLAGGMLRTQGGTSFELATFYVAALTFIGGFLLLARKRLRDRSRPTWLALPYLVVPPMIIRVGDVVSNGQGIPTLLCYVLGYGLLIWTIVDLGVLGSRSRPEQAPSR
jgi:uncharacterized membrane protein YhaH (DUF805 family)